MEKHSVSITDFGAVQSKTELQTQAIQQAIDNCFLNGGGTVVIPDGVYLTGGIRLRSNVRLYLKSGAVLLGSRNPMDYFGYRNDTLEPLEADEITDRIYDSAHHSCREYIPGNPDFAFVRVTGSRWNNALIRAIHASNISICGESGAVIDGADCFDELGEEQYRGPHAITFFDCHNILLDGYTVQNSSNWAHNINDSDNILYRNITVNAGHDGAHFSCCRNIDIRDSEFYTGDDCIAGFSNTNVTVKHCIINSACSAMRFGGTNVTVSDCHIYGPGKYLFRGSLTNEEKRSGKPSTEGADAGGHRTNMLSLFTYYADYSLPINEQPGNIVITDCVVENADRFLHYNYSGNENWQKHRPLENITFKNIRATGVKMPLTAYGSEAVPLTLILQNITISQSPELSSGAFIHACHYRQIMLENIAAADLSCKALIKRWSDSGEIVIKDVCCNIPESSYICDADEDFVCKAI